MLLSLMMNTILQWFLLLIIPLLVYVIFFRKDSNVFAFFGLKRPRKVSRSLFISSVLVSVVFFVITIRWPNVYDLGANSIHVLAFSAAGLTIQTVLIIFIEAVIKTALLEEIIWRGFLINTFRGKFGFTVANHIQAFIFTAIHFLAYLDFTIVDMVLGTISVYVLSLCFGKLMKESGYSIVYSVIFHSSLNIIGAIMLIMMH